MTQKLCDIRALFFGVLVICGVWRDGPVLAADKSPVVARRPSRSVRIDPRQIHLVRTFKHDRPLWSCRFHPGGETLFAGAQDRLFHRWDLTTGKTAASSGHRSWIRRFAFLADGTRAVSGDYFGRLIWWDLTGPQPKALHTVQGHRGYVRAVAVSPDGRWVATGGNDLLVRIWTADGKPVATLTGHKRHVYDIAFHPDGKTLISGDLMGVLKQWQVGSWMHRRDFQGSEVLVGWDKKFQVDCGGVRGLAFSPDGNTLAVAAFIDVKNAFAGVGTPAVVLFDYRAGKRIRILKPATSHSGACWGVVWHPRGFLIGVGGMNAGKLFFWKPEQESSYFDFKLPNVAYDLALHPSGRSLAVACYDGALRVYDLGPKPAVAKKPRRKSAGRR